MRVLVAGGAGFIGSHAVVQLIEAGHDVVIADNFENAKRDVLARLAEIVGREIPGAEIDLCDRDATYSLFAEVRPDAVMHFAGLKAVAESVEQPLRYYSNNLESTFSLLAAMASTDVSTLVFSSSATVYAPNERPPLTEDSPTAAINPYGWTKVMIEQVLTDVGRANPDLRIGMLRYFNPVGAHPSGLIGEDPLGRPNNLMPLVVQTAAGIRNTLQVFGNDYPTRDGTGVRDFIHVEDLVAGHLAALDALARRDPGVRAWNLGTGRGTTVLELIDAFERATGVPVPYEIAPRRPGDSAESFANVDRAKSELGWQPRRTLAEMCADSWRWHQNGAHRG